MEEQAKPRLADRLGSTLFLAALAHGVIILGITFGSAPFHAGKHAAPSLNVTLVVNTNDLAQAPEDAQLLAQVNERGHGSLAKGVRPTAAAAGNEPLTRKGKPGGKNLADGKPLAAGKRADVLMTPNDSPRRLAALPKAADRAAAAPQTSAALLANLAPPTTAAELDERAADTQQHDRELIASPSTRQSILAEYLDGWRQRVERIGTLHFPARFRGDKKLGKPVLEVAIKADGQLADIVVRRSSGDGAVDQAALDILRMAAPFAPLPASIRAKYDVLRFAYEWDFSAGAGASGG